MQYKQPSPTPSFSSRSGECKKAPLMVTADRLLQYLTNNLIGDFRLKARVSLHLGICSLGYVARILYIEPGLLTVCNKILFFLGARVKINSYPVQNETQVCHHLAAAIVVNNPMQSTGRDVARDSH